MESFNVVPIGVVHSPFKDKRSAPRQPKVSADTAGRIELFADPRFEHALSDVERWSHLWVLFWFHLNEGWRPKVRPPRSVDKRGVFSTRAPHRPNPIGLSAVALDRVDGLTLHVRGLDIVDGSPVIDIKPYVPYADIVVGADSGWLGERPDVAADVGPSYAVAWTDAALERLWFLQEHGVALREDAEKLLALGPTPHAYRRIRVEDGSSTRFRMALRDFRLRFELAGRTVTVFDVLSGYRRRELADPCAVAKAETSLDVHRAFVQKFG